ncbi:hypothetical protein PoB_007560400 [Plakobranchus ocellatus]|uniref:Uncharacterized protein n=1 Tax=Plakobranchus ocellatus TaxID=259542 RepID=A0AAV4DYF4_9GAST|nr:hypothetical protein PoB_007560400 [Plakobranchus ocellatus]
MDINHVRDEFCHYYFPQGVDGAGVSKLALNSARVFCRRFECQHQRPAQCKPTSFRSPSGQSICSCHSGGSLVGVLSVTDACRVLGVFPSGTSDKRQKDYEVHYRLTQSLEGGSRQPQGKEKSNLGVLQLQQFELLINTKKSNTKLINTKIDRIPQQKNLIIVTNACSGALCFPRKRKTADSVKRMKSSKRKSICQSGDMTADHWSRHYKADNLIRCWKWRHLRESNLYAGKLSTVPTNLHKMFLSETRWT